MYLVGAVTMFLGLLCVSCAAQVPEEEKEWSALRARMVEQLRAYKISDAKILSAMAKIRRHVFIPASLRGRDAYGDHPCPIGHGQTISQPFIVAHMTERMGLKADEKVLEIGTGSGYQAAIMAELGAKVYSIEIVPELAAHARQALDAEDYKSVQILAGDGYKGWPEHAPFDAIIVTCAPADVPQALVEQLKDGGRMILPVGDYAQQLVILRKKGGKIEQESDLMVRFVPMVHGKEK